MLKTHLIIFILLITSQMTCLKAIANILFNVIFNRKVFKTQISYFKVLFKLFYIKIFKVSILHKFSYLSAIKVLNHYQIKIFNPFCHLKFIFIFQVLYFK